MSKKSHHFLTLWPWPLTYDLEKLIRSGHYHYQCVYQIWEQAIPWFFSYRVNTIAGGGRRVAGGFRRKTITSPDPSDTGDIINSLGHLQRSKGPPTCLMLATTWEINPHTQSTYHSEEHKHSQMSWSCRGNRRSGPASLWIHTDGLPPEGRSRLPTCPISSPAEWSYHSRLRHWIFHMSAEREDALIIFLVPGRNGSTYKSVISDHMSLNIFMSITSESALRRMPQSTFGKFNIGSSNV